MTSLCILVKSTVFTLIQYPYSGAMMDVNTQSVSLNNVIDDNIRSCIEPNLTIFQTVMLMKI